MFTLTCLLKTHPGSLKPTFWALGLPITYPLQAGLQPEISYVLSAFITASVFSSPPPDTPQMIAHT